MTAEDELEQLSGSGHSSTLALRRTSSWTSAPPPCMSLDAWLAASGATWEVVRTGARTMERRVWFYVRCTCRWGRTGSSCRWFLIGWCSGCSRLSRWSARSASSSRHRRSTTTACPYILSIEPHATGWHNKWLNTVSQRKRATLRIVWKFTEIKAVTTVDCIRCQALFSATMTVKCLDTVASSVSSTTCNSLIWLTAVAVWRTSRQNGSLR